jgi:hypothetical protein
MALDSEQLLLPVEIRPKQKVAWYNVNLVEKRRFLFWKEAVAEAIWQEPYKLARTTIDVEKIADLKDAKLRYALRLAAAADSMGWIEDSPGSSHAHYVTVNATDESDISRFAYATYTGRGQGEQDTFMADIRSFASVPDENH